METIALLTLLHSIIMLISSILAVKYSSDIIFHRKFFKRALKISPLITIYFVYNFICNLLSILNSLYAIAFWRPDEIIYNAYLLYGFGIIPWLMFTCTVLVETMLCIDRCLSLIFPLDYDFNKKKLFMIFTLGYIFIGTAILVRVCSMIEVFPISSKTSCRFFGCLMTLATPQFISTTKALFSLPNVLLGIALSILIHKIFRNKRDKKADKVNKTVYLIVGITTISVLLPSLCDELAKMTLGKPLNTFIGPYGNTLCACGSTVCIQIYSKAFKRLEIKFHATSKQVTTF